MDTNINNYSDDELLEILGLDSGTNKNVIENTINNFLTKFHKHNNNNLVEFFKNIKNRLVNNNNKDKKLNQSELWYKNQYLPNDNTVKKERTTNRSSAFEVFKDNNKPVMKRENLSIQNSLPLEIGQGTLNPNLRQKESRIIMIDSKDRAIISPFSNNPLSPSSSTNFTCNLSIVLNNVINIRLTSIFIPKTFYVIDNFKGNNFFFLQELNINTNEGSGNIYKVTLPDGNYKIQNYVSALNISLRNTTQSNDDNINRNFSNDLEFYYYPDLSTSLLQSYSNTRIRIVNKSDKYYKIIFYDRNINLNQNNYCLNINYYTTCLGYYLGFRYETNCENSIPDVWNIILDPSGHQNNNYLARTIPNIIGSKYLNLCVDDFQNNQSSSSFVYMKNIDNKVSLPNYAKQFNENFNNDSSLNCFENNGRIYKQLIPTYPRKLTQNQLYSANSILLNQQQPNDRLESNKNQNVLATINIPSDLLYNENITSIALNNISRDSTYKRDYFGPVNIQRLKISLYDNYGFLVNLNGHDWNFTMQVEQLYQY